MLLDATNPTGVADRSTPQALHPAELVLRTSTGPPSGRPLP
jgi:hypothetical protein